LAQVVPSAVQVMEHARSARRAMLPIASAVVVGALLASQLRRFRGG
jgi:putative effector of murein hydrolase LrgA (UPF0299 family)